MCVNNNYTIFTNVKLLIILIMHLKLASRDMSFVLIRCIPE